PADENGVEKACGKTVSRTGRIEWPYLFRAALEDLSGKEDRAARTAACEHHVACALRQQSLRFFGRIVMASITGCESYRKAIAAEMPGVRIDGKVLRHGHAGLCQSPPQRAAVIKPADMDMVHRQKRFDRRTFRSIAVAGSEILIVHV